MGERKLTADDTSNVIHLQRQVREALSGPVALVESTLFPEIVIDVKRSMIQFPESGRWTMLRALRELSEEFDGRDEEAIVGMAAEEFTLDARIHPERYQFLADWFVREATLRHQPEVVVDVGCGPGVLTQLVADRLPDTSVLGLDLSPDMLQLARSANVLDRVQFVHGDAREVLEIAQHPVDALISRRMIHRVDGLETVLERLAGAVRHDGGMVMNYSFRCPTDGQDQRAFLGAASHRVSLKSLHAAFVRAVLNAPTLADYVEAAYRVRTKLDLSACYVKVFPFDVGIVMVR